MNTEKHIVRLSNKERQTLETIVKKLKGTSQKVKRAIINVRKQLVLEGFEEDARIKIDLRLSKFSI